jgi:hypothetical protein
MMGEARKARLATQAGRSQQQRRAEHMRCQEANIRTRVAGRKGEYGRSVLHERVFQCPCVASNGEDIVMQRRREYLHATKGWRSERAPA